MLVAGSYAVAAHSTLRRALAGLGVTAVGATIYGLATTTSPPRILLSTSHPSTNPVSIA